MPLIINATITPKTVVGAFGVGVGVEVWVNDAETDAVLPDVTSTLVDQSS
jgi:hypothetical protein